MTAGPPAVIESMKGPADGGVGAGAEVARVHLQHAALERTVDCWRKGPATDP